mmetsp:Transcript_18858/g.18840  ORF Transcript_18858/g.18840 Transcript_18858/m.18840 type:complete len:391 (-) Transcript_18858:27-1199(-)
MFLQLLMLYASVSALKEEDPDVHRNFMQVCVAHGYQAQSYQVTTADGYILTLFRIPGKTDEPITSGKPVAFLQHGLLDLSDTWIMNEPAPGFILADAGFDVWFGNSRGSFHSLGHVKYNPWIHSDYWDFTWQHMAEYDIPAVIPFVLNQTGQKKLTYVGHSQGTLQMFAHLAEDPSFMKYINIFIALAPVGTVRYLDIDFFNLLKRIPYFDTLDALGIHSFLQNANAPGINYVFCDVLPDVCDGVAQALSDSKVSEDNTERFPVILSHEPGGTSVFNMMHWQQMTNYLFSKMEKYDYGSVGNLYHYGSIFPPTYDISKIPGPIALFFGIYDRLADPKDGDWLRKNLNSKSIVYLNTTMPFGHLTYLWGKDLSYLNTVISLAKQYSTSSEE